MNSVAALIDALTLCIPNLDASPLRDDMPKSTAQLDILEWLYAHLGQQGLMVYEEWKEYFGDVPELHPLSKIDFSTFDNGFVVGLLDDIDLEQADDTLCYTLPYEMPYLEYINAFLQPHGLRLVSLLPFENAYIFCVKDDAKLLENLVRRIEPFDMNINWHDPLDQPQAKAYIENLLAT